MAANELGCFDGIHPHTTEQRRKLRRRWWLWRIESRQLQFSGSLRLVDEDAHATAQNIRIGERVKHGLQCGGRHRIDREKSDIDLAAVVIQRQPYAIMLSK